MSTVHNANTKMLSSHWNRESITKTKRSSIC